MTPRVLAGRLLLLSSSIALFSCQLLYGLDDYEGPQDPSGQGAAQGSSANAGQGGGSTGSTSSGLGGGGPCVCAQLPPAPWQGPYFVFSTPEDMAITTCPDAQAAIQVWEGPPVQGSCTSCSCNPGPPCSLQTLQFSSSTINCSGTLNNIASQFADGQCKSLGFGSLWVTSQPSLTGSCAPMGGQLQSEAWQTAHALCNPLTSKSPDCSSEQTCFSLPTSAEARLCIMASGNALCPSDWSDKVVGYQNPVDTRSCSPCTCSSMQGVVSCNNTLKIHDVIFGGCNDPSPTSAQPGNCYPTPAFGRLTQPQGAFCTSSGGVLSGNFQPGLETTLCCAPLS